MIETKDVSFACMYTYVYSIYYVDGDKRLSRDISCNPYPAFLYLHIMVANIVDMSPDLLDIQKY